jgi:hypothetical protein
MAEQIGNGKVGLDHATSESRDARIRGLSKKPAPHPGLGSCSDYHGLMSDEPLPSSDVLARAQNIKLFLMDVDGTPTDGGVCLISSTVAEGSEHVTVLEMKVFDTHDGQGLSLAHTMGIQTEFITGRRSPAVAKRAEELRVTFVYLGQASRAIAGARQARFVHEAISVPVLGAGAHLPEAGI